ncbi:MAG: hypothetical protein NKF70_02420 [Methanobacterium sp. ERen5]|nr:MAG: hypothetical protein NKF70_02420 [Methanobacterium sp. ERen5]
MLETKTKEILKNNTFFFQFLDEDHKELSPDQSAALRKFKTVDGSKYKMDLRSNAMLKSVQIDLKIIYPPEFYHPNIYELLNLNETLFQSFYNDNMGSESTDYSEIAKQKTEQIRGK